MYVLVHVTSICMFVVDTVEVTTVPSTRAGPESCAGPGATPAGTGTVNDVVAT